MTSSRSSRSATCSPRADVRLPRRGHAGHARAADDREGMGAGPGGAAHPGRGTYDLVVVDAPATGHGVGMLAAPRTFARSRASGRSPAREPRSTRCCATPTHRHRRRRDPRGDAGQRGCRCPRWSARAHGSRHRPRDRERRPARRASRRPTGRRWRPRSPSAICRTRTRGAARRALRARTHGIAGRAVGRLAQDLGAEPPRLPFLAAPELGRPELELLADHLEDVA